MLSLLVAYSTTVISEAASWDPASLLVGPPPVGPPLYIPTEPPTLVLAIIGLGLFAVYGSLRKTQQYKRRLAAERAKLLERRWQPKRVPPPPTREAA